MDERRSETQHLRVKATPVGGMRADYFTVMGDLRDSAVLKPRGTLDPPYDVDDELILRLLRPLPSEHRVRVVEVVHPGDDESVSFRVVPSAPPVFLPRREPRSRSSHQKGAK